MREYSETTQTYIDAELARLMAERYDYVTKLLGKKQQVMDYIAQRLLEKETIDASEFKEIIDAEKNLGTKEESNDKQSE